MIFDVGPSRLMESLEICSSHAIRGSSKAAFGDGAEDRGWKTKPRRGDLTWMYRILFYHKWGIKQKRCFLNKFHDVCFPNISSMFLERSSWHPWLWTALKQKAARSRKMELERDARQEFLSSLHKKKCTCLMRKCAGGELHTNLKN